MSDRPASGPLDILSDLPAKPLKGPRCDVQRLRRDHPDLADQLDRALEAVGAGRLLSDSQIARWISDHGFPIGEWTIGRHRKDECLRCRTIS